MSKQINMDNIKQQLIELLADFLDSENFEFEQALAGVKDPQERENTDLHIKMADAAFAVYRNSVVSAATHNHNSSSAAPELLEAAKDVGVLLFSLDNVPVDHPAYQRLKEAIRKAQP